MKNFQLNIGCQTTLRESESQTEIFEPETDNSEPTSASSNSFPLTSCYGRLELHHLISRMYAEKLNSINAECEGDMKEMECDDIRDLDELRRLLLRERIEHEVSQESRDALHSAIRRFDDTCMQRAHKMDSRLHRCLKRSLSSYEVQLRSTSASTKLARRKLSHVNAKYLDSLKKFGTRIPKLGIPCLLGLSHAGDKKILSPELKDHIKQQIARLQPLPTRTDHSHLRKKSFLSNAMKLIRTVPISSPCICFV
jgi:hypothetical protein